MTIAYRVGGGLYLNITNRCPCHCVFCVRDQTGGVGDASSLWLPREPTLEEVWHALAAHTLTDYAEIVFCGYGEPTERLDAMLEIAGRVKTQNPGLTVRLNTNGLGSLIAGFDITPRFLGSIDVVSVSLNAARAVDYDALCAPRFPGAFDAMLEFTRRAVQHVPRVVMTVVDGVLSEADIALCRALATSCGAAFRVRASI